MTLQTSFHVACSSAANAVDAAAAQKLRLVSPPEMVFAILLAVARDVQAQDPDKIAEWRDLLTGVPCTMHFLNGEDKRHIFAVQQRENYAQNANSMRLTALQKLFDVQSVMERKKTATGAATLEELAKYYENVGQGQRPGFVQLSPGSPLHFEARLSVPRLPQCAFGAGEPGGPFDHIKCVHSAGGHEKNWPGTQKHFTAIPFHAFLLF